MGPPVQLWAIRRLAQCIGGGADIIRRPLGVEPGGLGRVTTAGNGSRRVVPVGGGLADTAIYADTITEAGASFVLTRSTTPALLNAVAGGLTGDRRRECRQVLMWRTMGAGFSWNCAASHDDAVYGPALDRARTRT